MYWRRRVVAGIGAVVAIAVVIALIVWAGGSSDDSAPKNAAAASSTTPSTSAPAPAPSSTPAAPTTSEPVSGGGEHGSDGGPTSTQPPAPAAPGDAAAQNICADQSLSVVLYTDKPTYAVGDQPVFTLVVTNGGLSECNRDLGKNAQNVVVRTLDGSKTLWAAQDCAPDKAVNNQLLAPGQQFSDTITWSGTTSSPGCKKPRVQIPAGGYQATAKIGEKESAPITFNIVKPAQG